MYICICIHIMLYILLYTLHTYSAELVGVLGALNETPHKDFNEDTRFGLRSNRAKRVRFKNWRAAKQVASLGVIQLQGGFDLLARNLRLNTLQ